MVRMLSYNILVGATRRVDQVERMIRSVEPDVVGLVEATDPRVVEELALRLDMQHIMTFNEKQKDDRHIALLSRLPVIDVRVHRNPRMVTKPVLEATIEETDGRRITVFVTHLSAAFNKGRGGDHIRQREARELLRIMAAKQGEAHAIMGDFNNLAPGDAFKPSALLRYVIAQDRQYRRDPKVVDGHPYLNFVVPGPLRLFNPLLRLIPRSKLLSVLFNGAASIYAPRGSISLLRSAGYVDCFRAINPSEEGFTCPAASLAGRIDYIFASPELVAELTTCSVVTKGDGISGEQASDHLPVVADFGVPARERRASTSGELDHAAI